MSATLKFYDRKNVSGVLVSAGCLLLVAFVGWLVTLGGGAHALNDRRQKAEMTTESNAVCKKWGVEANADKYADCLKDIQTIRAHQWERIMEDFDSFGSGAPKAPAFH